MVVELGASEAGTRGFGNLRWAMGMAVSPGGIHRDASSAVREPESMGCFAQDFSFDDRVESQLGLENGEVFPV